MLAVTKDAEKKLLEMANSLRDSSRGYYAVHYHFSELQPQYRSEYQVKISINILTDIFRGHDGVVFVCRDTDLVLLYHGDERGLIEKAIFQLRYLFMDDPLAYNEEGFENEDFCTVYDLEFHSKEFLNICRRKVIGGETRASSVREQITGGKMGDDRKKMQIFLPTHLAQIENDIRVSDIGPTIRSQPACALIQGRAPKAVFEETYVNIAHLRRLLRVDVDLLSNKALFKHLTELLDKRVLYLMTHQPTAYFKVPLSLNLNTKTLLTEEFNTFDAMVPNNFKPSVIIEVHISDVFEDISTFKIAKEAIQKMGYRVCLDGINSTSFPLIDRGAIGCDLVKLQWNPEMKVSNDNPENRLLAQKVEECGANRVVLCWCDNEEAIQYGRSLGISLFQGRHVDRIVNPSAKIVN